MYANSELVMDRVFSLFKPVLKTWFENFIMTTKELCVVLVSHNLTIFNMLKIFNFFNILRYRVKNIENFIYY